MFVASHYEHYDVVKCLLSSGADINLRDKDGHLPKFVALSSKYYDIFALFNAHEENVKAQYKTSYTGTKDDEFLADSTTLLNTCGYPEEQISHSKEKQGKEKEAICIPKVQEGKEETILTREQEETEEIISIGETKEEKDKTTEGRKEQKK